MIWFRLTDISKLSDYQSKKYNFLKDKYLNEIKIFSQIQFLITGNSTKC